MEQIISGRHDYDLGIHCMDILRYVSSIVDISRIDSQLKDQWQGTLEAGVKQILNGIKNMPSTLGTITEAFDSERAGIVMFRY